MGTQEGGKGGGVSGCHGKKQKAVVLAVSVPGRARKKKVREPSPKERAQPEMGRPRVSRAQMS